MGVENSAESQLQSELESTTRKDRNKTSKGISKDQRAELQRVLGPGQAGALEGLRRISNGEDLSGGLQRETVLRYLKIAENEVKSGTDKYGVQALRYELLSEVLKQLK